MGTMSKIIKWQLVKKKLKELKVYDKNPRRITDKGMSDLKKSIDKFGLAEPIVINTDLTIIGGHARYFALKEKNSADTLVDCFIPNRKLTDKEIQELNIRLNKNIAGEFDFDILANEFEIEDLLDWGFNKNELGMKEIKEVELPRIYQVVIECESEEEQQEVYNTISGQYKCRILTL